MSLCTIVPQTIIIAIGSFFELIYGHFEVCWKQSHVIVPFLTDRFYLPQFVPMPGMVSLFGFSPQPKRRREEAKDEERASQCHPKD